MGKEEDQFWSDAALEAAKKAKEEAEAQAKATGQTPPPPDLSQLLRLIGELASRGGSTEQAIQSVVKDIRSGAALTYELAVNGTAQERHRARLEMFPKRYVQKKPEEAKETLDLFWKHAKDKGVAPTDIINDPAELQHSAVAIELTSRLTTLGFQEELAKNPKIWWEEVARAYQSIDFDGLTAGQEAELRKVFENAFSHMRELAKQAPEGSIVFPKSDKKLWRGLGDYYFSSSIVEDSSDPNVQTQQALLRKRVRDLQEDLGRPHTVDAERKLLEKCNEDLETGLSFHWGGLREDVEKLQYRLVKEAQELSRKPEAGAGRGETAEERAKASETLFEYTRPDYGEGRDFSLTEIDQAIKAFYDEKNPERFMTVRGKLRDLDSLFVERDPYDRFRGPEFQQKKLRTALEIINELERSKGSMNSDQLQVIEGYKNAVLGRMETLSRGDDAPNRLYLMSEEQEGAKYDPVGTVEGMFFELSKAFNEDPNGPLAEFYMDRMQLLQYYIFSKRHGITTTNLDVVVVKNKQAFLEAVQNGGKFEGKQLSTEEMTEWQSNVEKSIAGREKVGVGEKRNFERSYINRFHEILFIQQWKHADSAGNENFQRFLNTRMLEDDFWNMDGQFGGLLEQFRQTLARKYEAKMFDANGDRNPHLDRFWTAAIKETIDELRGPEYADYAETWNRYLNGEFFMDVPDPDTGQLSTLQRKGELAKAHGVPEPISYYDACEMITHFASYRMIMSQEKYLTDLRYLPVRWGAEFGMVPLEFFNRNGDAMLLPLEFRTQFYEKQKIAKLANSFEAWMITWGGITSGMTGIELLEMRGRAKILRTKLPEINQWGDEWARDWWDTKVIKLKEAAKRREDMIKHGEKGKFKLSAEEQRMMGEMRALFSFTEDLADNPHEMTDNQLYDWITFMDMKKLKEETTFYAAMRAGAMEQGLTFYMGVSESGARRSAQYGALKELLGGDDELTRQNFLTYVDVGSSRGYFQKKLNKDTMENKISFLTDQAFVARFAPHSRLLALREGDSFALRDWIDKHNFVGGKKGFGKFYENLARYYENIHEELALEQQVDYSKGWDGLTERQKEAVHKVFKLRLQKDDVLTQEKAYFEQMQQVSDFLLKDGEYQKYAGAKHFELEGAAEHFGALKEFTDIRFGQILIHMRRDDYKYKWVQNPDRAWPKLMMKAGHPLYSQEYVDLKKELKARQDQLKKATGEEEKKILSDDINTKKAQLYEFVRNYVMQITQQSTLRDLYWTSASDKFEPKYAQDEQSGLWRRNWRDVGAAAGWWDLTGDRWSLDSQTSMKARMQTYKAIVGVNGNDIAKINDILDEGQRLIIQLVDSRFGPWLKWMRHSSDVKKVHPEMESRLPDDLLHQYEVDAHASGGVASRTALGAVGMEYALKDALGVSHWDKRLGGMVGREELLEKIHHMPVIGSWARKHFTEKQVESAIEWLDDTLPMGIIMQKLQIAGAIGLLFFVLYTFQSASEGEEKKRAH